MCSPGPLAKAQPHLLPAVLLCAEAKGTARADLGTQMGRGSQMREGPPA